MKNTILINKTKVASVGIFPETEVGFTSLYWKETKGGWFSKPKSGWWSETNYLIYGSGWVSEEDVDRSLGDNFYRIGTTIYKKPHVVVSLENGITETRYFETVVEMEYFVNIHFSGIEFIDLTGEI